MGTGRTKVLLAVNNETFLFFGSQTFPLGLSRTTEQ